MIDLRGVPAPELSPPPGACLRVERPEPGLAVVVLDPPHRSLTVFDLPLLRDLDGVLDELETSPELRGVVLTGRDPLHFATGIDLELIENPGETERILKLVKVGQRIGDRIEGLRARGIRTVAAVGGAVSSGAYELALSCGRIVLADDPGSSVGLPETRFGLLPAWGGCRRLPRRIGVPAALEMILRGRARSARRAYALGLVDRLTPPGYLLRIAGDIAMGRRSCPPRGRRWALRWAIDRNPLALGWIGWRAWRRIARRGGGLDPALKQAVRRVVPAALEPRTRARDCEAVALSGLAGSEACENRIRFHRLEEHAPGLGRRSYGSAPPGIDRAAVFGAGTMGGAIAGALAEAGIATRLFDHSPASLDTAVHEHRARQARRRRRGRLEEHEERRAIDHLAATALRIGFGRTQLAIEAVTEQLEAKRAVFTELASSMPPETILATNTSSLSVNAIASGIANPGRVVGMHFFHPVPRRPLVEIVRGERTEEETVTVAAALALRLGKTPLLVADVPGFLINRLLCPYLDEALRLYAGGLDPLRLEEVMRSFGMPVGPLRLSDEVGLDVVSRVAGSLHVAYGERMKPCEVLEPLLDAGHLGRKSGDGFHVYLGFAPRAEPRLSSDVRRLTPPTSSHEEFLDDEEIVDRLCLPMVNEAARCLEEGVVERAEDVDLGTVLGLGFPAARGGLLRWADSIGTRGVLDRLEHCATAIATGPNPERRQRFEPAERLRELAAAGRGFLG